MTLKEKPHEFGMSSDKTSYEDPGKFDAVYVLTQRVGWSSVVSVVLFDFAGDDLTLVPPKKTQRKDETWTRIETREKLESALKEMDASLLELITFRPCLMCSRFPVGAYFAEDFIEVTYNSDDQTLGFQKIDALLLEGGGGSGGDG
jgi:hypothetical protein